MGLHLDDVAVQLGAGGDPLLEERVAAVVGDESHAQNVSGSANTAARDSHDRTQLLDTVAVHALGAVHFRQAHHAAAKKNHVDAQPGHLSLITASAALVQH